MKYELKISQAADLLGVSEGRISQLIASNRIDSVTINGRRRISKESVEQYRDSVRTKGRPPKPRTEVRDYLLLSGEHEVMRLAYDPTADMPFDVTEVLDAQRCPWGTVTRGARGKKRELNEWWRSRAIPNVRPGIGSKLNDLNVADTFLIPFKNLGLSLSDCYWIVPADDSISVSWKDVNYFDNPFADVENERWDFWLSNVGLDSPDNTSEGALPKKWTVVEGKRMLLKGCRSDDQRPYNEAVATSLHARLLQPGEYVPYRTVQTASGPACACPNFLDRHEEYIPAAYLMGTIGNISGNSFYDRFCRYVGTLGIPEASYREHMAKMIVCDALIANSDRHRRNFGFIRNIDTLELRAAPIFDSGNCLWYEKTEHEVACNDWSYAAKPFGPQPERQLAMVDSARWFDGRALDGFVDQATEILSNSAHATEGGRLGYIRNGMQRQVDLVSQLMKVLSYR